MAGRGGEEVRWSVEQRLSFASARLFWDGSLNREDIMRRFGVSVNQATHDVGRLVAAHPGAVRYDTRAKRYVPEPSFAPAEADPAALLTQLRLISEGQLSKDAGVLALPPPLAIADAPARRVPAETLRQVLRAIRDGAQLTATYVSFQRPEPTRRRLSPHALVFDGFRWHARAHDADDDRFKDFLLSRLSSLTLAGPAVRTGNADVDWHTLVTITLAPHPALSPAQRAVIAEDYAMTDERLALTVRQATAFYTRKRLGLLDGHRDRPAWEQHVVEV